ncbi:MULTISPECIES: hypothetical protein [Moorena]|uniref:NHL repeat protein n=1 Tax=Moorena producens 3L TaxID=489825 RepID=F4XVX8_9CYAN|nr:MULTISPECIES: hypothetical protein [Moorena]EGJ31391.1 hypothetical protein LYNGBM3L_40260 [Moorena producens 3L]NEP68222.1 hypothetical protein [Moorena sp. SIO3A5]OLT67012.1 hypothetical protein BI334_20140 [Moorena producens 3L]
MLKLKTISSLTVLLIGVVSPLINTEKAKAASFSSNSFNIETITTGLATPYAVAIDNDNLIVTVDGALIKIDQSGNISTLTSLAPGVPSDAIVFGSDYVVIEPAEPPAPTSLLRVTPTGEISEITENTSDPIGFGDPIGLAIQNQDLIITDFNRVNNDPFIGDGRLLRYSNQMKNLSVIASSNLGGAAEVFVDGENFWVTDFTFGRLLFVTANGDVTEIATELGQPLDIEFDGQSFLITDFANGFDTPGKGRILRVSKTGQVETLLSDIGNPSGLAIDGDDLLFTDIVDGRVARIEGILATQSVPESSSNTTLIILGVISGYTLLKRQSKNN